MSSHPPADRQTLDAPEAPAVGRSPVGRPATQLRISQGALAATIRELRSTRQARSGDDGIRVSAPEGEDGGEQT